MDLSATGLLKMAKTSCGELASQRGVWIVTKTYSANSRCLTVLSTKGTAVTVGIDVTALKNSAEVRASSGFWREHSGELWNTEHDVSDDPSAH